MTTSKELLTAQALVFDQADSLGRRLADVTGMAEFSDVTGEIAELVAQLKKANEEPAVDADDFAEQSELVSDLLTENIDTLTAVIGVLHGLPSIEVTNQSEPALVRLIEVLAVASEHQTLLRSTTVAEPQQFAALAKRQEDLASRCEQAAETGEAHPLLANAAADLATTAAELSGMDREAAAISQQQSAAALRQFIIEQALLLDTSIKYAPSEGDSDDGGEGSDSESDFSAGFISDFVSGETPKDKRTEWKVLGERNRAALNQNFARELPLEYRGLLKNYYERISQ